MTVEPTQTEKDLQEGLAEAAQQFAQFSTEPAAVDNTGEAAFDDGEEDIFVNTGRSDPASGAPVRVKVTVIDPKMPELGLAYLASKNKERAALALWRAMVTSPKNILRDRTDENYKKELEAWKTAGSKGAKPRCYDDTTTAFRNHLTYRLLRKLGVDGDFFDNMMAMAPTRGSSPAVTSSTPSPAPGAGAPPTSAPSGAPAKSGMRTSISLGNAPTPALKA